MSYSTLITIDKDFKRKDDFEFTNSWLFTPIALDLLFWKYMPSRAFKYGMKNGFISATMFDKQLSCDLNEMINNSQTFEDRIVWELSNQQVFFCKDKYIVSDAIKRFYELNIKYGDETCKQEHIKERFFKLADTIMGLSEDDYCFIHKNTSVDDNVDLYLRKYNEEDDEYINMAITDWDKIVCEFVLINDGNIDFTTNLNIKEKLKNK